MTHSSLLLVGAANRVVCLQKGVYNIRPHHPPANPLQRAKRASIARARELIHHRPTVSQVKLSAALPRAVQNPITFLRPDIYTEMLAPLDNLGRERERKRERGKAEGESSFVRMTSQIRFCDGERSRGRCTHGERKCRADGKCISNASSRGSRNSVQFQ